jgi:hypothetical protein
MTDAEFEALVARLEQQAQRSTAAYRRKVILLACVGYAYVALVVAIAGGLFVGALATAPYLKGSRSSSRSFSARSFGWSRARCGSASSRRRGGASSPAKRPNCSR